MQRSGLQQCKQCLQYRSRYLTVDCLPHGMLLSCPDMPQHGHDYATAKILRTKGLSYSKIAEETGIPYDALAKYASRHQWDKNHDKAVALMSKDVMRDFSRLANGHVEATVDIGKKRYLELTEFDFASAVKKLDAEGYLRCFDLADRILRRALKLDEQAATKPAIALQVNVSNAGTSSQDAVSAHVIDDEHVADATLATPAVSAAAS